MVLINIDFDEIDVHATTLKAYITTPTSTKVFKDGVIASKDTTYAGTGNKIYAFKNNGVDSSSYIVAENCVINGDTKYDLVIYPFLLDETFSHSYISASDEKIDTGAGFEDKDLLLKFATFKAGHCYYKLFVTEHGNINNKIDWKGFIGASDLDKNEYVAYESSKFSILHRGSRVDVFSLSSQSIQFSQYVGTYTQDDGNKTHEFDKAAVWGLVEIPKEGFTIIYGARGDRMSTLGIKESNINDLPEIEIPDYYTIEFDANDGSGAPDSISKTGTDTSVVMGDIPSTIPTRSGYTFKGWSADGGTHKIAYLSTTTPGATQTSPSWTYEKYCDETGGDKSQKTLTLYAQWKPIKYYVMYHGNANFNTSQGDYKHPETLTYDVDFTLLPTKFSRDVSQYPYKIDGRQMNSYKFIGWGLTPNQTYADYTDKQTVKNLTTVDGATVDLYAIWQQDLHLKFDLNGGEFN